jgi:hypothetical protein
MGSTTDLRREVKRIFIPFALSRGFILDQKDAPASWAFRRTIEDEVHIFDVQWEKYGRPRFVINFGKCPAAGLSIRGKHFLPEEILPGWVSGGRLQPKNGAHISCWFRRDKPLLVRLFSSVKRYEPSQVVSQLMELFPEVEAYWVSGVVGPHLRIFARGAHPNGS